MRTRRLPPVCLLWIVPAWSWIATGAATALPVLTIDDVRVPEGQGALQSVAIKLHLTPSAPIPVIVAYHTVDGTATVADGDYEPLDGVLEFPAGAEVATIVLDFHGDNRVEGNEWLRIRLTDPEGATIGDNESVVTLVNDDGTSFSAIPGQPTPYLAGTLPNAWADFDGDDIPDLPLYAVQPYGGLIEIPGFRSLLADGNYHGVSWCDYDKDGDADLVLLGYASSLEGGTPTPSKLLRNDGGGVFVDVAPAEGMDHVGGGETAVWADFDGDGWPDLFTPYYSHIEPFQSFLYRNNGDGTFTERAEAAGVSLTGLPAGLRPEGAQAADWNDDGHTDLYCAHHLFVNDGTGVFTDVRAGVGLPELFDEGAAFVDCDGDGDLDLFLRATDGPRLFRNDSGQFTDVTAGSGLTALPTLWGDSWADVDGDGDLDLLLQSGDDSVILMLNHGDATFERDVAFDALHALADLSAWADIDGDGDLDLVLGSGARRQLYRNHLDQQSGFVGSHLAVRVLDADGWRSVYGATVRLLTIGGPPGTTQTRTVDGGSGYLGQNEYDVHFGGLGSGRYALEVIYPSPAGSRVVVDSLTNPQLGRIEPSTMSEDVITVRRDGTVTLSGQSSVAGVPARGRGSSDRLCAPSPSPARDRVALAFDLAREGRVALELFDLRGRRVRSLEPGAMAAGRRSATWDLRDAGGAAVPSGIYFCRLVVDGRDAGARRVLVAR